MERSLLRSAPSACLDEFLTFVWTVFFGSRKRLMQLAAADNALQRATPPRQSRSRAQEMTPAAELGVQRRREDRSVADGAGAEEFGVQEGAVLEEEGSLGVEVADFAAGVQVAVLLAFEGPLTADVNGGGDRDAGAAGDLG